MDLIRIKSVADPLRSYAVASRALGVLRVAEAMGLLPEDVAIERLDAEALRLLAETVRGAGVATEAATVLASGMAEGPEHVARLLRDLELALEQSPLPEREWPRLDELFGADQLAALLSVSPVSVRRYRSGSRPTPDDVAARLHFLALVVGDLSGAYNAIGTRRWFHRPRSALEHGTPADVLVAGWSPEGSGPRRVRELARALVAPTAT